MAIPMLPFSYDHCSQFILPPSPQPSPSFPFSPQMHHPDHTMSHAMQPSQQSSIPLDPSLGLYPQYFSYQQQAQPHMHPHMLPMTYPSPSSQGSETMGTPPVDRHSPQLPNPNGKRVSPVASTDSRKKPRKDNEEEEVAGPSVEKEEKVKPTRGSRACTVCRRLKMKCVGAEQGPPCKRCLSGNHECIFEESNRGKRSSKKHELLTRSLRKMERTLDTVLRSIGNPTITSGMISRSPTPSPQNAGTQALLTSPSPPPSSTSFEPSSHNPPGSPILHSLPDNNLNPLGLLAEASLANRRVNAAKHDPNSPEEQEDAEESKKLGVASDNYFKPGPINILPLRRLYIERQVQPEMLSFVTTEEVIALFKIYFDHINMHCSLLDPEFHTPSLVCSRSPFLLTTICSISAKFYTHRPELQSRLQELAKKLAFNVPSQGYKSVEIVQAYLLLSLWGCGAVERYEQDKTWLLLGMAIRMATDLNLHRKTAVPFQDTPEGRARDREVHIREKTWLLCFCLDRSLSAQMGKPHSIKEDYIIRNADTWFRSPIAQPTDSSIAAYAGLQRLLSRSLDFLSSGTSQSGLQVDCDYLLVIKTFETQFFAWRDQWFSYRNSANDESSPVLHYKRLITRFYFQYAMLVLNSFGLQNALERSNVDIGHFFGRCHSSAMACALLIRDELGPSGFLKYSPDSHFVFTSYAVLSLLKLIRPEFRPFMDNEAHTLQIVKDVADVLGSVAANQHHTPALYSSFLRALLSARVENQNQPQLKQETPPTSLPADPSSNGATPSGFFSSAPIPPNNPHLFPMNYGPSDFPCEGEMGPVADMSTFPPTMAANADDGFGMPSMDGIFSSGFWDNVLVPGYSNTMEGLSGGFVFGLGGSGLISPRFGGSPVQSRASSPTHTITAVSVTAQPPTAAVTGAAVDLTQHNINAAFTQSPQGMA